MSLSRYPPPKGIVRVTGFLRPCSIVDNDCYAFALPRSSRDQIREWLGPGIECTEEVFRMPCPPLRYSFYSLFTNFDLVAMKIKDCDTKAVADFVNALPVPELFHISDMGQIEHLLPLGDADIIIDSEKYGEIIVNTADDSVITLLNLLSTVH